MGQRDGVTASAGSRRGVLDTAEGPGGRDTGVLRGWWSWWVHGKGAGAEAGGVTESIHGGDGGGVQAEVDVAGHGEGFVIRHAVHPPARESRARDGRQRAGSSLVRDTVGRCQKSLAWWHVPNLGGPHHRPRPPAWLQAVSAAGPPRGPAARRDDFR